MVHKTFQLGGVASATTITGGLPRVEELFEGVRPRGAALLAPVAGTVACAGEAIVLRPDGGASRRSDFVGLPVPAGRVPIVAVGVRVAAGQALTDGPCDPHELLALAGRVAVEEYLVGEIAGVYRAQGVGLDRRHLELVVRRMTGWATVDDGGDTTFLPGQLVAAAELAAGNASARASGQVSATSRATLLGVTRAALASESFLAAAGFQETTGVLADAALARRSDRLSSLKSNVLLGRRIPLGTGHTEQ